MGKAKLSSGFPPLPGGGGGEPTGVRVGVVTNGSTFPTTRYDGSPLQNEDYVSVNSNSTFPFTIGTVTFNTSKDKAYWVSGTWYLDAGIIQDTDETPLSKPEEEKYEETRSNQYQLNKDIVGQLKNAIIEYTDLAEVPAGKLYKRIYRQTTNTTEREAGLYWYNFDSEEENKWVKLGNDTVIINAESHQTIDGYAVPTLTDEQILNAYNGVVAGKNVFIVDDMDYITIQVLDASSIDGIAIRLLFTDKMILTYKEGGEVIAFNLEKLQRNAYESIEMAGNIDESYLAHLTYTELDYPFAKKYFDNLTELPIFGCSAFVKDGHLYRNYDWGYSESCEFAVETPGILGRYAVTGTVGQVKELTKDFVKSGAYSELYKVVPFFLVDGKNEHGLKMTINVVPNDKGDTTGTLPGEKEINALMLVRWVLDHCDSVDDAIGVIRNEISIYVPQIMRDMGYEVHYLISDDTTSVVLEFVNNAPVFTEHTILTNFFIDGVTFKADGTVPVIGDSDILDYGLTSRAMGLERYNLIVNHIDDTEPIELLEALKYTNLYTLTANKWYSELCGYEELDIGHPVSAFEPVMEAARQQYAERTRDGVTDQTVHSAVYEGRFVDIRTQENFDKTYTFNIHQSDKKATFISDNPSDDKIPTEKAIYDYIASGSDGEARLLDNVDLDTVFNTGFYFCNMCAHRPVTANGILLVGKIANNNSYAWQQYNAFAEDKVFVRFRDNNTWKDWEKVETDIDTTDLELANASSESYSGEATTQAEANEELVTRIKFLESKPDVSDIVQCYDRGTDTSKTDIAHYDLTTLFVNDIVKVLIDETHDDKVSYYKVVESGTPAEKSFSYIGSDKPVGVDNITITKDSDTGNLEVKDGAITDSKVNAELKATEVRAESSAVDTKLTTEKAVATALKDKIGFKLFASGQTRDSVFSAITENNKQLEGIASFTNTESPDGSVFSFHIQVVRGSSASNGYIIAQKINSTQIYKTSKSTSGWTTWQEIVAVDGTSISKNANGQLEVLPIKRAMWDEAYTNRAYNITGTNHATREALLLACVNGTSFHLTKFTTASENPDGVSSSQLWNIAVYKEDSYNCQFIAYKPASDEVYKCYRTNSGWEHWVKQSNSSKFIEISGESGTLTADQLAILNENDDNYIKSAGGYIFRCVGSGTSKMYALSLNESTGIDGQDNVRFSYVIVNATTGTWEVSESKADVDGYKEGMKGAIESGNTGYVEGGDIYTELQKKEEKTAEIILSGTSGTLTSAQLSQVVNKPYSTAIVISEDRFRYVFKNSPYLYFARTLQNSNGYVAVHSTNGAWNKYGYTLEQTSNKVTSISSSSSDTQYPSAKAVYTELQNKVDFVTGRNSSATREDLFNKVRRDENWTFFGPVSFTSSEGPEGITQWMSVFIHKFSSWGMLYACDRSTGNMWVSTKSSTGWNAWVDLNSVKGIVGDSTNRTRAQVASIVSNTKFGFIRQARFTADESPDGSTSHDFICEVCRWSSNYQYIIATRVTSTERYKSSYLNGSWSEWEQLGCKLYKNIVRLKTFTSATKETLSADTLVEIISSRDFVTGKTSDEIYNALCDELYGKVTYNETAYPATVFKSSGLVGNRIFSTEKSTSSGYLRYLGFDNGMTTLSKSVTTCYGKCIPLG